MTRRNVTRPQRQRAAGFSCAELSTARCRTPILQLTILRFREAERAARSHRATGFGRRLVQLQRPHPSHATGAVGPQAADAPLIFTSGSFSEHCIEGLVLLPQEVYF